MLDILNQVPEGFLETSSEDIYRILPRPTLIHLPGRRERPLFLSILLHGNEDTGLIAIQSLLRKYRRENRFELPRALSFLVCH